MPIRRYTASDLVRCATCGFVCSGEVPSIAELGRWYARYSRCDEISAVTLARYDELLASFEAHRQTNQIADLGCGNGHFLARAAGRGWIVTGSELTDDALAICRAKGITTRRASSGPDLGGAGRFDVVTAFEVLEHLREPMDELRAAALLLRPGGILYVTTPNFDAVNRHLLRERWRVIQYPEHLGYFTRATLDQALTRSGLRRLSLLSTGVSVDELRRALTGGRFSPAACARPASGVSDESIRQSIQRRRLLRGGSRLVNRALTRSNLGETLKATYQRSP
jgi:2-polyprenyl-3-methyl-5-hydroxy-6-metoxy-1,4-benzoquinol methylase